MDDKKRTGKVGRPKGPARSDLHIWMPKTMMDDLSSLARIAGKSRNQLILDLIEHEIKLHQVQIRQLKKLEQDIK